MQQKQLFKWFLATAIFLCSYTLTFAVTTTWQGTIDSDWTNAANWNNGVPTVADDARILPSPNDPEINGTNEKALSLVVRDGAKLTITGAGKLTVELSTATGVVIRDGGEIEVDDGNLNVKNTTNNGIRIADGTLTVNTNGQVKSQNVGTNGILIADDGTIVNDGDIKIDNAGSNGISNVINGVPAGLIDISGAGTWKIDITSSNGIRNYITATADGEISFQHDGTLTIVDAGSNGIYNRIENGTGEINFTSNDELTIKSPADVTNGSGIRNHLEANSNSDINFKNNTPITIKLGSNSNHGIYNENRNTGSSGLSQIDWNADGDIIIKNVGGKGIYNLIFAVGPMGAPTANGIDFRFSALLRIKDCGGHGMDNFAQNIGYKRIFILGKETSTFEIINAGGRGILNQVFSGNGAVNQGHIRISLNGTSEIKNPTSRGLENYGENGGRVWFRNQGIMTINGGTVGAYNETFNGNVEVINSSEAEWYIKNTSGNSVRSIGNGGADREFKNSSCAYMEVDNRIFTDNFLFRNNGILKTTFNGNNTTQGGGYPGEFKNGGLISDPDGVFNANPNGLTGGGIVQTTMPNIEVDISSIGSFMFCAGNSVDLMVDDFKILPNTYIWSTTETTQSIAATAGGIYTVTVTDNDGCTGTATADVTENPLPIPVFTGNTTNNNLEVCSEEMGVVYKLKNEDPDNKGTYGGAFPKYDNYIWSVVNGTISNKGGTTNRSAHIDWPVGSALGGVYVTVTDDNGCIAATSVEVTVLPPVMPTITGTFEYCVGNSTVIDAGTYSSTPNMYTWSNTSTTQTIEVSTAGVYTVTVTTQEGCSGTASVDITEHALPVPIFDNSTLNNSLEVCSEATGVRYRLRRELLGSGGTIYGNSNGGTKYDDYQWSVNNGTVSGAGGSTNRRVFVDWPVGPATGEVYVTVTDANGCIAATSVEVTVRAPLMPTITGDFEICPGDPAYLDAGSYVYTPNTYIWSNALTTQTFETSVETVYTVTVTDNQGCSGIASVETTDICDPYITGFAHNGATICPDDDVVATVADYQMMTYGHAYTLTFILFESNSLGNTYYDHNATGTFSAPPPGDYTVCAYNELTDCQPNPSPNTSNLDDLADVGTIGDGCYTYDCSTLTIPEPFTFDIDNATLDANNSTGNNIYSVEFCGGTPNYTLGVTSSGFVVVNQLPNGTSIDCRDIQVIFGNGADWSITVTDSHGCADANSVIDSDDVNTPFPILSIDGFSTENEKGVGTKDGSAEVVVSGGDDTCGIYDYMWSGSGGFSISTTDGTTGNEITNLAKGAYSVTVTDCVGNTQVGDVHVDRNGRSGRGGRGKSATNSAESSHLLTVNPNPFVEKTVIEFTASIAEKVSIDVFTISGQHVANLFEGQASTENTQSIVFDGNQLQPGTYIVRLLTKSGEIQHQKIVLMK